MAEKTIELQRKILGVLMRNARQRVGLTIPETATLLGMGTETLTNYEFGRDEAGLPTLEALAEICHIPLSYFWSEDALPDPTPHTDTAKGIILRRKMVGVLLAQAREQAGIPREAAAKFVHFSPEALIDVELGNSDIPLSQLKSLLTHYNISLDSIVDEVGTSNGENGASPAAHTPFESMKLPDTSQYPEDVQAFLQDPANMLYIKLAMKLHGLSANNLRALAEGILDITY